jgi:geranylgeranyl diphosphate synthase type II
MNITELLKERTGIIDKALYGFLPGKKDFPGHLQEALRYSIFSGGKRVRPFLVTEAVLICGGTIGESLPLACAFEMIHTYSLIHDDLPSMDDDSVRRGKKTCHVQFDEATAILAGDALLSHAFNVIASSKSVSKERIVKVIQIVSRAIGPYGMVAGQAADMKHQERKVNLPMMNKINGLKTGELITACLEAGALWGGGSSSDVKRARLYGRNIGFLFQVVDDIIDADGYAAMAGIEAAYKKAEILRDEAKKQLKTFGQRGKALNQFADFLYERKK